MEAVLSLKGLRKSYRTGWRNPPRNALDGLDLEVPRGEIAGLLGPNGAGKTTTLKCILGLVIPESGSIRIFGEDGIKAESRRKIGFLPEQPYFDLYLKPHTLLSYYGRLAGLSAQSLESRIPHLLSRVGLEGEADLPLEKFSKGMLQRMGLAQALLTEPELLILDEPSGGLDPAGKIKVRDLLLELREGGAAILLSSHQLSEIEEVCDRVDIIDQGRNVASGSLESLLGSSDVCEIVLEDPPSGRIEGLPPSAYWVDGERRRLCLHRKEVDAALRALLEAGARINELRAERKSLEDYFMEHVKGRDGT